MADKKKIKVMVAEDIRLLREDFAEIIEEADDMELLGTAGSAADICRQIQEEGILPDVILMDIEMETLTAGSQRYLHRTPGDSDRLYDGA